jgi:hypothetical protein
MIMNVHCQLDGQPQQIFEPHHFLQTQDIGFGAPQEIQHLIPLPWFAYKQCG